MVDMEGKWNCHLKIKQLEEKYWRKKNLEIKEKWNWNFKKEKHFEEEYWKNENFEIGGKEIGT